MVEGRIAGADLVAAVADDLAAGRPTPEIAAAFHEGVADVLVRACIAAEHRHAGPVVLSGGSFQSLRLLGGVAGRLGAAGVEVLEHHRVPPNDAGISVGQAAVAAARMASCA
jgi:hydrogenase maturation protein HypF